jgi:hypothetical protein
VTPEEQLLVEAARRGLLPAPPPASFITGMTAAVAGPQAAQTAEQAAAAVPAYQGGVTRGMMDIPEGGAQLITRGLEAVSPKGTRMEAWARGEREKVEAINQANRAGFDESQPGATLGRVIGNFAAAAPVGSSIPGLAASRFLPRMAAGATSGATTASLQPVEGDDYWSQKGKQVAAGTVGGAVAPIVAAPLRGFRNPQASQLMDEGITPTPGQIAGGTLRTLEERATSIPVLGDAIAASRRKALDEFNRATLNKVLAPIGQKLDDATEIGQPAIAEAATKIGKAYDDLLPKLKLTVDQKLGTDLTNAARHATLMTDDMQRRFLKVVQDEVQRRTGGGNTLTGEQYKEVVSAIGQRGRDYLGSSVASERELGKALMEVQGAFKSWLYRSNPDHAAELRAIDRAYAMLSRTERAGGSLGAAGAETSGRFTPFQLLSATKAEDPSLKHKAFSKGTALMQDWAQAGTKTLGSRYPDSGTAGRAMLGLAGMGALGGSSYLTDSPLPLAALLMTAPYLPGGRQVAANLMTSNPAREAAASLFGLAAPTAGGLLAPRHGLGLVP